MDSTVVINIVYVCVQGLLLPLLCVCVCGCVGGWVGVCVCVWLAAISPC